MEKKSSVTFHDLADSREFAEFFAILHDLTKTVIGLSAPGWKEVKGPAAEMTAPVCQVVNSTAAGHEACIRENLRHTEEALAFIDRSRDQPFLLYVPYSMPHTPIFRSEAFAGRSLGGRYGDVIEELDWSVGAIATKLTELGLAEVSRTGIAAIGRGAEVL